MGNIAPRKGGGTVHGVAYQITQEQLDQVYGSEGGPHGPYQLQELLFDAYDGRQFEAKSASLFC